MSSNYSSQVAIDLFKQGKVGDAKQHCHAICSAGMADADTLCLLCVINGSESNFAEAERYGLMALDINSVHPLALFNTAVAQFELNKYDSAVLMFHRVLEQQPEHPSANYLLARCYDHTSNDYGDSLRYYEQAYRLMKKAPRDLVSSLAELYERTGQYDKSQDVIERYLSDHPNDPVLGLLKAVTEENEGELDAAKDRLEILVSISELKPTESAPLHNRLGLVLDKLADYDNAFEALHRSQQIAKDYFKEFDGSSWRERIVKNSQVFTESNVKTGKTNYDDSIRTPIFLIGFPRSGTTLTERIISTHPEIYPSSEASILYDVIKQISGIAGEYPRCVPELDDSQVLKLREMYMSLADDHYGGQLGDGMFLDKLPLNIIELGFVNKLFPEAKIILMLRDPRDSVLSCFMQLFGGNDAMANFYDLESGARFYDETMKLYHQFESVLDLDVFRIRYEDVVSDMQLRIRELMRFLNLDWTDEMNSYMENRKYKINTPSYHDTNKPIFNSAIGRWKHYEKFFDKAMPYLLRYVDEFGYSNSE